MVSKRDCLVDGIVCCNRLPKDYYERRLIPDASSARRSVAALYQPAGGERTRIDQASFVGANDLH